MKIDGLSDAVSKALAEYSEDVTESIKNHSKDIAKKYAKELKKTSPKLTGDYSKGWRVKETANGRYKEINTIHNKTEYPLTHLLEHGHIGRDGKRVQPVPHIAAVEEKAVNEFLKKVQEDI